MGTQITVTLPDDVYRRAKRLAVLTSRNVADVLADAIILSFSSVGGDQGTVKPLSELSDEEILSLAELRMEPAQDRRLSVLLDRQQAGKLTEPERSELHALMQVYQEGLLRKARALREAVQRGLMEPLEA